MKITRRQFLARGGQLGALLILPSCGIEPGTSKPNPSEPKPAEDRFFLQIMPSYPAGWDSSYLFDARPLSMTKARLIQNYLGEEPELWTGRNGTMTWASSLTKPLKEFQSYFNVINGVHMSPVDGHDQNFNFLMTGDALGGKSFIPLFNQTLSPKLPLDAIQHGTVRAVMNNTSQVAAFTLKSVKNLLSGVSSEPIVDPADPLHAYVLNRFKALGQGTGSFSAGSAAMGGAMGQMRDLAQSLKQIKVDTGESEDDISFLKLVFQAFRGGISRSAIIVLNQKQCAV